MKYVIISLIFLLFISCRKEHSIPKEKINIFENKSSISKIDKLKLIDTTIILSKIQISKAHCWSITRKEAEKYLYKHFRAQGAQPRNEIKDYSQENLCIEYDTIYNLKSSLACFAIIRYWLNPADFNGNCNQPNMAIISRAQNGLEITNEEFVKEDFGIDSIGENQSIYAYKYDCYEHKVLNKYRLKFDIK